MPPDRTPPTAAEATAWIDEYLAGLPAEQGDALRALRATIATAAPAAEEAISYGLPAFRYLGRPLVSYGAARSHCSFFPMSPAALDRSREVLADYDLAKGTVRFTPDRPLPPEVVVAIVRDRMAEIEAARAAKRR